MKKPRPSEYKKKPKPSAQQELYAMVKAETGSTQKAKEAAGYSPNYPTKMLEHTDTMELALEKAKQTVQEKFVKRAEEMADQMYYLALNARSDQVKFQATKDLLDRAGFAPEQKTVNETRFTTVEARVTQDMLARFNRIKELDNNS